MPANKLLRFLNFGGSVRAVLVLKKIINREHGIAQLGCNAPSYKLDRARVEYKDWMEGPDLLTVESL
jgi:hypothetical protein